MLSWSKHTTNAKQKTADGNRNYKEKSREIVQQVRGCWDGWQADRMTGGVPVPQTLLYRGSSIAMPPSNRGSAEKWEIWLREHYSWR